MKKCENIVYLRVLNFIFQAKLRNKTTASCKSLARVLPYMSLRSKRFGGVYFRIKKSRPISCASKALFIWSRVPETTLPLSYPDRANFSLTSLKNSTNCLHELVSGGGQTTRVGELSRLGR